MTLELVLLLSVIVYVTAAALLHERWVRKEIDANCKYVDGAVADMQTDCYECWQRQLEAAKHGAE